MTKQQKQVGSESRYGLTSTCYVDLFSHSVINEAAVADGIGAKRLSKLQWQMLSYLMDNYGRAISYEELTSHLYPDEPVTSDHHRIDVNLSRLRKSLSFVGVSEEALKKLIQVQGTILFTPVAPISTHMRTISAVIRDSGMSENELADIVDRMMYQGICGRLGFEMLLALANKGNSWAAYEVGGLYYHGTIKRNRQPDFEKACEWFKRAGGYPGALWALGYCIVNGKYAEPGAKGIDYKTALEYFERAQTARAAAGGHPAALTSIGHLWATGHYPAKDYRITGRFERADIEKAKAFYKQADAMGYRYATNSLAMYYEKKIVYPDDKNAREAFRLYKRSTELVPDGYTFNKLGLLLEKGIGCKQDPQAACEYYIRAVEDVLDVDVTGWGCFNAGRVYANRIHNQPPRYLNLDRAFDLFFSALRLLPVEKHDQILLEMIDILLQGDLHSLTDIERRKMEVLDWTESYLRRESSSAEISRNPNTSIIRIRVSRL